MKCKEGKEDRKKVVKKEDNEGWIYINYENIGKAEKRMPFGQTQDGHARRSWRHSRYL